MNQAEEIEQIYRASFRGKFPYEDCRRLYKIVGVEGDLIPDLNTYFMTIAGFSSSASRLHNRTMTELQRAKKFLSIDAYQRLPYLERYRPYITGENTPQLLAHMTVADDLRLRLLTILSNYE